MRWRASLLGVLLLASVAQAATVDLAWDPPTGGDPPQGYTMYKRLPGQPQFELVASIAAGVLTWSDPEVSRGESCWYLTAWNQWGESGPSNTVCFFQGSPPGAPVTLRLGKV